MSNNLDLLISIKLEEFIQDFEKTASISVDTSLRICDLQKLCELNKNTDTLLYKALSVYSNKQTKLTEVLCQK